MPDENVAQRVLEALKAARVSQAMLARDMDISRSYLNDMVKGRRPVSRQLIDELRTKYGVSVDWVLSGEGRMFVAPLVSPLLPTDSTVVAEGAATYRAADQHVLYPATAELVTAARNAQRDLDVMIRLLRRLRGSGVNDHLHELLERALPPHAPSARRAQVEGYLQALVDGASAGATDAEE